MCLPSRCMMLVFTIRLFEMLSLFQKMHRRHHHRGHTFNFSASCHWAADVIEFHLLSQTSDVNFVVWSRDWKPLRWSTNQLYCLCHCCLNITSDCTPVTYHRSCVVRLTATHSELQFKKPIPIALKLLLHVTPLHENFSIQWTDVEVFRIVFKKCVLELSRLQ